MHTHKQPDYFPGFRKSDYYKRLRPLLISLIMVCANAAALAAQNVDSTAGIKPLDSSAFRAVTALFRYDKTIPLDARVLDRRETDLYVREKIVFTGVRGARVPGYLAFSKNQKGRRPLILLMHAGSGSKEVWWEADSFERGKILSESLLQLGFAVLALDAQFHGERSANNDYLPVGTMYFDKKWFFRFRDGVIETAGDYFRAIDYLSSRAEVDVTRLGVVGHSMGGVIALIFVALNPNVKSAVGCVAAASEPWLYPVNPINLAQGIQAPTLLLAGRSDEFFGLEASQHLYASLKAKIKKLELFDSGHRLPESNIARTVDWLRQYMAN